MEEEERDYVESEDEDFNPDTAAARDQDISSSSEDDETVSTTKPAKSVRKRKGAIEEDLDSGDEATIQELKSKKRKSNYKQADDSGGEGGLIKTRAQRRADKEERREQQRSYKGPVTIDVDSLWASLSAAPVGRRHKLIEELDDVQQSLPSQSRETAVTGKEEDVVDDNELITIKHSYTFAGQTVTEEKQVHRDSAEARLYQSQQEGKSEIVSSPKTGPDGTDVRRPLKRASRFEPNPTGEVKGVPPHKQRLRTPSRADVLAQQQRLADAVTALGGKAPRLNTVQKSKLDWATHVDSEGLKDELDEYGRSKHGYMDKMDFLQNVQSKKDLEDRQARLQQV